MDSISTSNQALACSKTSQRLKIMIWGFCWGFVGVSSGFYWGYIGDNGKEKGSYYYDTSLEKTLKVWGVGLRLRKPWTPMYSAGHLSTTHTASLQ